LSYSLGRRKRGTKGKMRGKAAPNVGGKRNGNKKKKKKKTPQKSWGTSRTQGLFLAAFMRSNDPEIVGLSVE